MNIKYLTFILIFLTLHSYCQKKFEKGYFIDIGNHRTDCLIRNDDWKVSPEGFGYKLSQDGETLIAIADSVKEFSIPGSWKFIRVNVKIDRSSMDETNLSAESKPAWSQESLFLKVLIEGKASLYAFADRSNFKLFYSVGDSIQQLIFKEYITADRSIAKNNGFRQQLWLEVNCAHAGMASVENIYYEQNALEKHFKKYNECMGIPFVEYRRPKSKNYIELWVTPGVNTSSLSISDNVSPWRNTDFGQNSSFRIGLGAEFYFLPYNKKSWAVVVEPSYQYFRAAQTINIGNVEINYASIEFPLGIRHYFQVDKQCRLFADVFFVLNAGLNFNSQVTFHYNYAAPVTIRPGNCAAFGGGVTVSKLSLEVRYYMYRNLLTGYDYWASNFHTLSLVAGYRLF